MDTSTVASFDPPLSFRQGLKWLREASGWDKDPLKWEFSDDARPTVQYISRLDRLRTPDAFLGEASHANTCFMVKTYAGKREIFSVDTEKQEINPLAFLAIYKGQREYYPDMEIGSPRQY